MTEVLFVQVWATREAASEPSWATREAASWATREAASCSTREALTWLGHPRPSGQALDSGVDNRVRGGPCPKQVGQDAGAAKGAAARRRGVSVEDQRP